MTTGQTACHAQWAAFWNDRADAGHRHTSDWWLRHYARELLLYWPDGAPRVLELGCGTGDLFEHLRDRCATYVGLDFSEPMLARFAERFPETTLLRGDATDIPALPAPVDFVFANEVCQNFDEPMLRRNLASVARLLAPGRTYLIANVPDANLRLFYYAGGLRGDADASWRGLARRAFRTFVRGASDGIGEWYGRRELARIAGECGFDCRTFSSAGLEYRFHALLTRRAEAS